MGLFNLENFKREYENLEELILSLDGDSKVILKPRNEICNLLESRSFENQVDTISELLYLCEIKAISNSFLLQDINENKISFENFLKLKLSSAEGRIKFDRLVKDVITIEKIKSVIESFDNKSLKINYLLEHKKILEGNFPESLGIILKKDPVYLFIKRELKYWIQYHEIKSGNKVYATGFLSLLTSEQISYLYNQMQNSYFESNLSYFKKIFINETLPQISEMVWIDKSIKRHEPNKQTIFEFFFLLKEYGYLDKSNFDTSPNNANNFYRKLEAIFPTLKNFPQANINNRSQKSTPRQKELERVISGIKS